MKSGLCIILAAWVLCFGALTSQALTLNGAGASFPAPVYRVWTYTYAEKSGNTINYQSLGSGAGISQIKSKTVDFGATDEPLKKEELDKNNLFQFPVLMGGVVPVANLPGVKKGDLKLTPGLLAKIYLGKIKKWNDDEIMKLNPSLKIASIPITVTHRSDGSGTTWIFTNYLAKVSKEWADNVGCGKAVKWPAGIGGQKNPGIVSVVKKIVGAIGYVEYTYAVESGLSCVSLQNKSGYFVKPDMESFRAAGENADWKKAPGFYMILTEQPGEKSWPITGVTYILLQKEQPDAAKAGEMLKYFEWCFKNGSALALKLNYVPMPESVTSLVMEGLRENIKSGGKSVIE
ncbi:MAG: phosphate ABC transporter substrate-binding protein PstS [Lentisphaerae bacterium GWF2_45_14]|nr:MAG: phosphate ABC transporter substrate-binding protein PstS [Lentisphaerae bacterium GWF2_45_14]